MGKSTPSLRPGVSGAITRHHLTKRDIAFSTNSYGYRDDEIGEKTDRDYRILVLGDSITLGDFADADQTYPAFIERSLLGAEHASLEDRDVRVINAGVGSIDLQRELAILMETGLLIEPDVVLVGLYLNDAYQSPMLKIRRLSSTLSWSHFLRVASMWLDLTRDRFIYEGTGMRDKEVVEAARQGFISTHAVAEGDWRTSREAFHSMIADKIHDWGYAWTDDFWQKIIPLLELMKQVGDEHGFRVAVMLLPVSYQVKSDLLMDEPQQEFDRYMNDLGLVHLDLLPPMREKYQRDGENIFYDHCHYRPEGNEYLAEIASDFLLRDVIRR